MLEMFFDNEKVFSVFKKILETGSEEVNMAKLLWDLKVPVSDAADILHSFVFLGILDETEKTQSKGVFKFNPTSKIVLAICAFDDVVCKHSLKRIDKMIDDGEDGPFSFIEEEGDDDLSFSSMKDFEEFLKENGLL